MIAKIEVYQQTERSHEQLIEELQILLRSREVEKVLYHNKAGTFDWHGSVAECDIAHIAVVAALINQSVNQSINHSFIHSVLFVSSQTSSKLTFCCF